MPMAPQSLYSRLWERGGKQISLEFSLKCLQNADTVKTSLLTADCSKFLRATAVPAGTAESAY